MKKVISILLATVMVVSMFAGVQITSHADSLPNSGTCGENVKYTFNSSTGELVISGTGEMYNYGDNDDFDDDYDDDDYDYYDSCDSYDDDDDYGYDDSNNSPFANHKEIKKIVIENGVTTVGNWAFDSCSGATVVTIPDSITTIGKGAFFACRGLEELFIPKSVNSIGKESFIDCNGLKSIEVSPDNENYDSRGNCNALIDTIENELLRGCVNTVIPATVWRIGDYAFSDVYGLKSVYIDINIEEIGYGAFTGCKSLVSMEVDSENDTYDSRNHCNAIIETESDTLIAACQTTSIPDSVSAIDNGAFSYSDYYPTIYIPFSVEYIGEGAFYGSELHFVYYEGDEDDWSWINIDYDNDELEDAYISYNHKHSFRTEQVFTKATSTTTGYCKQACIVCGFQRYFVSPPTGKPTDLKCIARTATSEKLTWKKTAGVNGYQVQMLNAKGGNAGLKTLTGNVYTFTKLAAGHAYKARVRFYVTKGGKYYYGPWTTINSPTLPAGTSLSKVTPAKKAFTAQWKKVAVTGYQIQYATNTKFTFAKVKAIKGAGKVKLSVTGLKGGARYYVRVRTFKTIGGKNYFSTWSGAKAVTTKK